MIVTFFLKLGAFFINYFGKLDTLINTLTYVRHFDILCINKWCQIGEDAYVYVNYHIKKQNNQQEYYQPMKKSHNHLKSPGISKIQPTTSPTFVFSVSANVRKKWGYERKLLTVVLVVVHRVFCSHFIISLKGMIW
jgi:hypothetical protein